MDRSWTPDLHVFTIDLINAMKVMDEGDVHVSLNRFAVRVPDDANATNDPQVYSHKHDGSRGDWIKLTLQIWSPPENPPDK